MRAWIFSLILAVFAGLAVATAGAQPYGPPMFRAERDRGEAYRDGVQPLDRLLPGIRRQHPGDFYDAEGPTYGPSGNPHYHLKWMTPDGRVIWFDTDARSGRVLRAAPGRDSFDDNRFRGGPDADRPRAYERPFGRGENYGGRGEGYGGGPYMNGPDRGRGEGPRMMPRYPRSNGDWRGNGRWRR